MQRFGKKEEIEYVVEYKIDGLSIALYYEDGILKNGVTRGDGVTGEDVTANVRTVKNIPLRLQNDLPVLEARGEVYLPRNPLPVSISSGSKMEKRCLPTAAMLRLAPFVS